MTVTAVASADGDDDFFAQLRAAGADGHALWCDRSRCTGVCRTEIALTDSDGRPIRMSVTAPAGGDLALQLLDPAGNRIARFDGDNGRLMARLALDWLAPGASRN